ncbi:site-specific integrase [Altererythrobacter sp. TH136]|uniref:site-specific integrase n=1 Tax=Altererythrobacter sp. TH136 TaxID=2067415 RepID=UPI001165B83C|nr:site-specific integrase [Altererythrobacter sp. TH136]QDM40631.1 site-specific integrase [Altererythrobacter sp. TH136]
MAKLKLTSAFCREVTCPPHKRKEVYRCTEQTGFGIEIRATSKTYWLYYTTPHGNAAQIKLGGHSDITFDQAKRAAKELRSKIVLGGNPAEEKANRKAVASFKELAGMHVEHAEGHLRSHACVELAHRRYLIPKFGKLRIDQVTTQAIENYLAELRQRLAPASVDRLRLVMHRSYKLAQGWGLPGSDRNPVSAVARPRYDNKRTCLLTPAEVNRLLGASGRSANPLLKPIVQILLGTAARRGEALNAKWEHIDFDREEWLIPHTKNGHPRRVPLSKAVMATIKALPRTSDWLLANPATGKPFDNIKRAWRTACIEARLPDLHIHDLRHAAIGAMINNGVSLHVAGKVAGHLRSESTARYAYVSDSSLAAAVEAGADNLMLGGAR